MKSWNVTSIKQYQQKGNAIIQGRFNNLHLNHLTQWDEISNSIKHISLNLVMIFWLLSSIFILPKRNGFPFKSLGLEIVEVAVQIPFSLFVPKMPYHTTHNN